MAIQQLQRGSSLLAGEVENHHPVSEPVSDALAPELDISPDHARPAGTGLVAVLARTGACPVVSLGLSQAPINA